MKNSSEKLMYAELKTCTSVQMVFDTLAKYYDLKNSKPGKIAKTLFAQSLPDELSESARAVTSCESIADMFALLSQRHNTTRTNLQGVDKIRTNLPKAIALLRPKPFPEHG